MVLTREDDTTTDDSGQPALKGSQRISDLNATLFFYTVYFRFR